MTRSITEWQRDIHANAVAHGFHDTELSQLGRVAVVPEKLCLIHSEVSETLEALRDGALTTTTREDGKPEGLPSELADVVIRCLDLAEYLGIDLEAEIERKHAFNKTRPYKHGKAL